MYYYLFIIYLYIRTGKKTCGFKEEGVTKRSKRAVVACGSLASGTESQPTTTTSTSTRGRREAGSWRFHGQLSTTDREKPLLNSSTGPAPLRVPATILRPFRDLSNEAQKVKPPTIGLESFALFPNTLPYLLFYFFLYSVILLIIKLDYFKCALGNRFD